MFLLLIHKVLLNMMQTAVCIPVLQEVVLDTETLMGKISTSLVAKGAHYLTPVSSVVTLQYRLMLSLKSL